MDEFDRREKRKEQDAHDELQRSKAAAQFSLDLKKVLSSPEGIRIFYHILDSSGVWSSSVKTSSEIYVKAGAASVGFDILENVQKICPENYIKILQHKLEIEATLA